MAHLFNTNDIITYGADGVCRVTGTEEKTIGGKSIEYYILKPTDGRSSTIYVPSGNEKLVERMRRLPSAEEVNALIDSLPGIVPMWIDNDNERKACYKSILVDGDHLALIAMIKALYLHKKEREANKKRLGISDERFMKEAEQRLYNEWQFVLKMGKEELMSHIFSRVE